MAPSPPPFLRPPRPVLTTAAWVIVATLWFAVLDGVAPALYGVLFGNGAGQPGIPFAAPPALAAGVLGGLLWWLLVEWGAVTYVRGVAVGGLTGILAHPVMWLGNLVSMLRFQPWLDRPSILAVVGSVALFYGLVSFFVAGALTLPLGCLGGAVLLAVRARFPS